MLARRLPCWRWDREPPSTPPLDRTVRSSQPRVQLIPLFVIPFDCVAVVAFVATAKFTAHVITQGSVPACCRAVCDRISCLTATLNRLLLVVKVAVGMQFSESQLLAHPFDVLL